MKPSSYLIPAQLLVLLYLLMVHHHLPRFGKVFNGMSFLVKFIIIRGKTRTKELKFFRWCQLLTTGDIYWQFKTTRSYVPNVGFIIIRPYSGRILLKSPELPSLKREKRFPDFFNDYRL
jgi:hypothetical protein